MTELAWQNGIKTIDFVFCYVVILLGYAAIMSLVVFALIWAVRRIWPKRMIGFRILCWTPLLLIPFLSKLKIYYETKLFIRTLYHWYLLCGNHRFVVYLYLLGCAGTAFYLLHRRRRVSLLLKNARKKKLYDEELWIVPIRVGAFSVGALRPKIVLSENLQADCTEEELKGIISHEKMHLTKGHIWMLTGWNILRVLYWINPFFHLMGRYFKEDIEHNCDMEVLCLNKIQPYEYGKLFIRQLSCNGNVWGSGTMSFADKEGFLSAQRRIKSISGFRQVGKSVRILLTAGTLLLLLTGIMVIRRNSYPRYTYEEHVSVTNEQAQMLLWAREAELKDVIDIYEDYILVDRDGLRELLPEGSAETEWLFLCWGGYMKLPGIGGAGEGVFIERPFESGVVRIPYISIERDPIVQMVKWI